MNADSPSLPGSSRFRAVAVVALWLAGLSAAIGDGPDGPAATLSVVGGTVAGRLLDSPPGEAGGPPTVRLLAPGFVAPLEFPFDTIGRIDFGPASAPAPPAGAWRVDLVGGDSIVGDVTSIDDGKVTVSIAGDDAATPFVVDRAEVRRIARPGKESAYEWDGSLEGWTLSAPGDWERSARGVGNRKPWATLARGVGGERVRFDLRLAWSDPPSARIEFQAPHDPPPPVPNAGVVIGDAAASFKPPLPAPSRIEIGDSGVVAVRDEVDASGKGRADLRLCGDVPPKGIGLTVFLDRASGRMVVRRDDRQGTLADFTLPPGDLPWRKGFTIDVQSGSVVLESLRVSQWRGDDAAVDDGRGSAVVLDDGSVVAGGVARIAGGEADLRPVPDGTARTLPLARIDEIRFARLPETDRFDRVEVPGAVRLTHRSGTILSGTWSRAGEGRVWMTSPAIGEVGLPVDAVVSIESLAALAPAAPLPARPGLLVGEGVSLRGCLVPVDAPGGSAIGWHTEGSLGPSALAALADGSPREATIRYRQERTPEVAPGQVGGIGRFGIQRGVEFVDLYPADDASPLAQAEEEVPLRVLAVAPSGDGRFVDVGGVENNEFMALLGGPAGSTVVIRLAGEGGPREITLVREASASGTNLRTLDQVLEVHRRHLGALAPPADGDAPDRFDASLVLVTGESIRCRVEGIDEGGVRVVRSGMDPVTVPHDLIQAVELVPTERITLTPEKFRSLTTLPRTQRSQPPTHLVRSPAGDYLRGRVLSLDGRTLRIAIDSSPRGKPSVIPRTEVARVVWLHPESLAEDWIPPRPRGLVGLEVEAIGADGTRTRIGAEAIEGNVLVGTHPVVGPTRIDLGAVDRLLLGGLLDASPRALPYSQWHLRPAADPRKRP